MKRSIIAVVVVTALHGGCPAEKIVCEDNKEVCDAFDVGSGPNDAKLLACGGAPSVVVADSGDGRIDTFAMPAGNLTNSVSIPNAPDPWAVAVDEKDGVAVVTLNALDALALVDACNNVLLEQAAVNGGSQPEPVVFDGDRTFYVGFTNILQLAPPQLDAGVVAAFTLDDDKRGLSPGPAATLPCKNPQGLVVDGDAVWAACSGTLGLDGNGNTVALDDGALVKLHIDANGDLTIDHVIDAGRSAPATPMIFKNHTRIVAGSLVKSEIEWADVTADALDAPVAVEGPAVESLFRTVAWDDVTALITQFSKDGIVVLDLSGDGGPVVSDFVQVGPGGSAFHGLLTIDVRHGFDDTNNVDGAALFTTASQIVPLRLNEVLHAPGAAAP